MPHSHDGNLSKKFLELVKKSSRSETKDNIDHQVHMDRLHKRTREHGFEIHNVLGDGNCLFHAVSHQLRGDFTHSSIRKDTVEWLRTHRDDLLSNGAKFVDFVDHPKGFDGYLAYLAKDENWGDHLALEAIARCYQIDIDIYSSIESGQYILTISASDEPRRRIYLAHLHEYHYMSLIPFF